MNDTDSYSLLPGMIDSHFHYLEMEKKEMDCQSILEQCFAGGMEYALDIATSTNNFARRLEFAELFGSIYLTAGLNPEKADKPAEEIEAMLLELEKQLDAGGGAVAGSGNRLAGSGNRLAGVGETGLDWHWNHGTREKQLHLFESQLALAEEKKLPVIIHNREADRDVAESLGRHKLSRGGIIHCFSSDYSFAEKCADLGFLISFAGNVTYKKNTNLHEAAAKLPLDCILAETDAPYLAPEKMRGKLNHPGLVSFTYRFIAELRGESLETLTAGIGQNFKNLFNLNISS